MAKEISRDSIMSSSRKKAAQGVMKILDGLQSLPMETQIVASACLFVIFTERFPHLASPYELLELASRLMNDAEGHRAEFKAARAYMENEWTN